MSFKIIGAAFDLPLIGNDKLVFLALCENADDNTRTCYPSYSTIQRKASLVNSSLKTCLLVLEAIDLIEIKIRSTKNGGRTSTLYKINEFDSETFDKAKYKKTAKAIRKNRNFREKKDNQSLKVDTNVKYSNLRNSIQVRDYTHPPKFGMVLDTQPPKLGEEPLAISFEPLAILEEEVNPCPQTLSHISSELLEEALDLAIRKYAKTSPDGFRAKLLAGVESGNLFSIRTLLECVKQVKSLKIPPWEKEKYSKREQGAAMMDKFQQAGFSNILDYLEKRGE